MKHTAHFIANVLSKSSKVYYPLCSISTCAWPSFTPTTDVPSKKKKLWEETDTET